VERYRHTKTDLPVHADVAAYQTSPLVGEQDDDDDNNNDDDDE